MILRIISIIIFGGYILFLCSNLFNIRSYREQFRVYEKEKLNKKILFVVPVCLEQNIIEESFLHFKFIAEYDSNFYIAFVTTEKEGQQKNSTYEKLQMLKAQYKADKIEIYHYPKAAGVMAHQVNFGVKEFSNEFGNKFDVAIYNVDSRISTRSLNEIIVYSNSDKKCIYQQYSYYLTKNNISSIATGYAAWQTRWSITYEYAIATKRLKSKSKNIIFEKGVYLIGHGVMMSCDIFNQIGGMPEESLNEDLFMGYIANNERISIVPLCNLESAENVSKVTELIKQQSSWFNGPFHSFYYYKTYCRNISTNRTLPTCQGRDKLRALVLAIKYFKLSIYWSVSPLLLLIIYLCYYTLALVSIVWFFGLFLYIFICHLQTNWY
jgi:hypothetical protein